MDDLEGDNLPLDSKIPKKETKQDPRNLGSPELADYYQKSSVGTTVKDEETDMKGKNGSF